MPQPMSLSQKPLITKRKLPPATRSWADYSWAEQSDRWTTETVVPNWVLFRNVPVSHHRSQPLDYPPPLESMAPQLRHDSPYLDVTAHLFSRITQSHNSLHMISQCQRIAAREPIHHTANSAWCHKRHTQFGFLWSGSPSQEPLNVHWGHVLLIGLPIDQFKGHSPHHDIDAEPFWIYAKDVPQVDRTQLPYFYPIGMNNLIGNTRKGLLCCVNPKTTLKQDAVNFTIGQLKNEHMKEGHDWDLPLKDINFPLNARFTERLRHIFKIFFCVGWQCQRLLTLNLHEGHSSLSHLWEIWHFQSAVWIHTSYWNGC